jgi:hypothetical protein
MRIGRTCLCAALLAALAMNSCGAGVGHTGTASGTETASGMLGTSVTPGSGSGSGTGSSSGASATGVSSGTSRSGTSSGTIAGSGTAPATCPATEPATGTCSLDVNATCAYDVDGGLLPNGTPCAYRDFSCNNGQWLESHNDPGTSQCGYDPFGFDGGIPDDCTPAGGTCIDPGLHACASGSYGPRDQLIPCGPRPTTYCCLPAAQTQGQGCIDSAQCQDGHCAGAPYLTPIKGVAAGRGVCTVYCSSSAACGAGFTCVDRVPCSTLAIDGGTCGHCLPSCADAGACAIGSCQSRTTVEGAGTSACDPCTPPSSDAQSNAGAGTCVLDVAP